MIDFSKLITILIEAGSFISALAAIVAAVIMANVTKKFGTGILARGFRSIALGVFFIAIAILVDSVANYLQEANFVSLNETITVLIAIKLILLVLGTYIIVIGSKRTIDNLESLTKK